MTEPLWYERSDPGGVLLIAPPGCGKTEQLARFAAHWVGSVPAGSPSQLLALTFSNKATANLRARIASVLQRAEARRVYVTNFHGLSYRLVRNHGPTIGLAADVLLPQPGWIARHRVAVARSAGVAPYVLAAQIREAKCGPFDDDEVMERLDEIGGRAAVAYESGLREAGRLDFDDALRHGARLLAHEVVGQLYRCRFGAVVVDECQDLTPVQYQMTEELGTARWVYAGDEAQGIYGFAGARPSEVYRRIRGRQPTVVELRESYRSSPPVLRAVSVVAKELGGHELVSATPERWTGREAFRVEHHKNTGVEALAVLAQVRAWLEVEPNRSVAVMARSSWRRRDVDALARKLNVPHEIWDYPVHRPRIVQLLQRHLGRAVARGSNSPEQLEELYLLCVASLRADDFDILDELNEAVETLEELILDHPLADIVQHLRVDSDEDNPVGAGLHLLTGHVGKGQQFDCVVVIGLEEGILPDFRAETPAAIREELAVLHVMLSRARQDLVVTCAADVRVKPDRPWQRDPSRWLSLLEREAASTD